MASFNLKIKPAAQPGLQQLTFTGQDSFGNTQTTSLTLDIQ
jgi:hypothetical protein